MQNAGGSAASELERQGAVVAGKYRLDELLGRGGMGSVWRATHVGLGRPVAVKLVSRDLVRSNEALRRFDAEAKAAARLQSRHVVQVFDNGVLEDGTPFITMELLDGQNLLQRIHGQGIVPLDEAVYIFAGAAKALSLAHAASIVHRDIKPDNIYLAVSPDDDRYLVKLLDFGIAKVAFSDVPAHESTRTGALIGTPHYMSPEQARGLKTLDYRSDLYSLGVVTFTMLTGKLAFNSDALTDLIVRICTQPLPSLLSVAPWLPPAMEPWFQRACAREPGDRFQTAQEMFESLRAAATSGGRATDAWGASMGSSAQSQNRMSMPSPLAPTALPQSVPHYGSFPQHASGPAVPITASSAPLAQSIGAGNTRPAGVPGSRTGLIVAIIAITIALPLLAVGAFFARERFVATSPTASTSAAPSSFTSIATSAPPPTPSIAAPAPSPSITAAAPSASASSHVVPPRPTASGSTPPKPTPTTPKIDLGY